MGFTTSARYKFQNLADGESTGDIAHTYLGAWLFYRFGDTCYSSSIPYYGSFQRDENGLRIKRTGGGEAITIENISGQTNNLMIIVLGFDF